MGNEIRVFDNEQFGKVQTVCIDGEPWFVGKDVAAILGYERTTKAVVEHVEEEDRKMVDGKTQSYFGIELGQRGGWLINESGLYSLILLSKLPNAKSFKRWVTSEVLPALRKNGSYSIAEKPDSYTIEDPAARARRWAEEYEEKKALETKIEEDKPKVEFAEQVSIAKASDCIDFSAMAKIIKNHDILVGRNKLFELARKFGWLRSNNEPYQQFINQGYFVVVEYLRNGKPMTKTLITGKGQLYITQKILDYYRGEHYGKAETCKVQI